MIGFDQIGFDCYVWQFEFLIEECQVLWLMLCEFFFDGNLCCILLLGKYFCYDIYGMMFVGFVVEVVMGKFYGEVMVEVFFDLVGMMCVGVVLLCWLMGNMVVGYGWVNEEYGVVLYEVYVM